MLQDEGQFRERAYSMQVNLSKKEAQKQLKANILNAEILKNRLKVLSSQADYQRFRQKYQSNKIQKHYKIHEQIIKSKRIIGERIKTHSDKVEKKENCDKIKNIIKQGLIKALKTLKEQKIMQSNQLKKEKQQNKYFLERKKEKDFQKRKSLKEGVSKMETQIRQTMQRYADEKRQDLRIIRQQQKHHILDFALEMQKKLSILSEQQKTLIHTNSESMSSSRVLQAQYEMLFCTKQRQNRNIRLPQIRKKYMDNTITNSL